MTVIHSASKEGFPQRRASTIQKAFPINGAEDNTLS